MAEKELRRLRHELANRLVEPPPNPAGGCTKIRLHARDEAVAFATRLSAEIGELPVAFNAYQCERCPKHPATLDRFWHIGHTTVVASRRARVHRIAEVRQARRDGVTLGDRLDPVVGQRLRLHARPGGE